MTENNPCCDSLTFVFWSEMDLAEEKKLVEEAKNSSESFGKLYDYYFPKVFAFVASKIGARQEAEDLTSEIFMKVLENLPSFEWRGFPFGAWVFTIARNTLNDFYQKNGRIKTTNIDEVYDISGNEETDLPSKKAAQKELKMVVKKILNELPEREASVIQLKFFSGLNNREIMHATGLSESNVGIIIYRTLRKIKPDLQYFA